MFCESRIGMSKFVLRAANCVKIASCHCAFGTVLTLTVTFGAPSCALPSSSRACAGSHSNHRNVSVIGSPDSLLVASVAAVAAPPSSSPPPHAASVSAAAAAAAALPRPEVSLHASSSNGLALLPTILHPAARNLRPSCNLCQSLCQFLHFHHPRDTVQLGHRHRATQFAVLDPADGSVIRPSSPPCRRTGSPPSTPRRRGRGLGRPRAARARRGPPPRVRPDDRTHRGGRAPDRA